MFFNENLYLEDDDVDAKIEGVDVDDAVKEAEEEIAEEDEDLTKEESARLTEHLAVNAYTESLEWEIGANEYYSNLREKMMNVEHIAALKEAKGLRSESSALLEAGAREFFDRVVEYLQKMWKKIQELAARVINFISSLFVTSSYLEKVNAGEAWKLYEARLKKSNQNVKSVKVKLQYLGVDKDTKEIINDAFEVSSKCMKSIAEIRSSTDEASIKGAKTKALSSMSKFNTDHYRRLINSYNNSNDTHGVKKVEVRGKQTVTLDQNLFNASMNIVKNYKVSVAAIKKIKDETGKLISDAIKQVREAAKTNASNKVSAIKSTAALANKSFSVVSSVLSGMNREAKSIASRVVGAGRVGDKNDKMTSESFDMSAYFSM